jgi:hypothetical protein
MTGRGDQGVLGGLESAWSAAGGLYESNTQSDTRDEPFRLDVHIHGH